MENRLCLAVDLMTPDLHKTASFHCRIKGIISPHDRNVNFFNNGIKSETHKSQSPPAQAR